MKAERSQKAIPLLTQRIEAAIGKLVLEYIMRHLFKWTSMVVPGSNDRLENLQTRVRLVIFSTTLRSESESYLVAVLFVKRSLVHYLCEFTFPEGHCVGQGDPYALQEQTVLHSATVSEVMILPQRLVKYSHAERVRGLRKLQRYLSGDDCSADLVCVGR